LDHLVHWEIENQNANQEDKKKQSVLTQDYDKENNQAIVGGEDKLENEPRDFQNGKFIYDAISDLYNDSNINDPRVRELLFTEIYKLPEDEFIEFIENAINNELTNDQKKWASDSMRDIVVDLRKDDTGLSDLD
jgi:hypothetical protein